MRVLAINALVWALGCSTGAMAQGDMLRQGLAELQGTLSVSSSPQMSEGKLTGCTLVFEVLQQDFVYLQGNFVRVSGNVGFMEGQGNIAAIVKVVAMEIDPDLADLGKRLLPPDRAYIVAGNLSTNFGSLVSSSPSDTPGALFSIYQLEPSIDMILEALSLGTITIAFSIEGGNSDIRMPIELNVVDVDAQGNRTRSADATVAFMSCTEALFSSSHNPVATGLILPCRRSWNSPVAIGDDGAAADGEERLAADTDTDSDFDF